MKSLFKYLTFCVCAVSPAAFCQESEYVKRNFLYASLEAGYDLYTTKPPPLKYEDYSRFQVQQLPYRLKTPGLGLGNLYTGKWFFFRSEFLFWYGSKEFNYFDFENGHSGPLPNSSFEQTDISDAAKGILRIYNLDWDLAMGLHAKKGLSVFGGFRNNFLLHYTTRGNLKRNVTRYQYNGWNNPPANYEYRTEEYSGKQIKDVWTQYVYGLFFINLGVNYRFKIREAVHFAEMELCLPPDPLFGYYQKLYINLRLARCFRGKKNAPVNIPD